MVRNYYQVRVCSRSSLKHGHLWLKKDHRYKHHKGEDKDFNEIYRYFFAYTNM